jgi:glycosyltransferase involved in cell wall biosynthesis
MESGKGLSVIVPTHEGRGAMVRRLVDSYVDARRLATLPSELIVVDSATGEEAAELEAYCARRSATYLRGPQPAGVKRNLGASAAQYDALLFIDSDCTLTEVTLREHEHIFDLGPEVGAVIGAIDLSGPISPLWKVLAWSGMYSQCFDHPRQYEQVLWAVSANFCVLREPFEKVGGFDEHIVTPVGGEDVDFGVRLTEAGFVVRTNERALARHAREHVTVPHVARSMYKYGRADTYLCQRHPHRSEVYLDPVASGVLAFAVGRLLHRRTRSAVVWGVAGWAAAAARRQAARPYTGPLDKATTTGTADLPRRVLAGVLDSLFDVGRIAESLRTGRLDLAARRFRYVDDESFVPRKESDDAAARR